MESRLIAMITGLVLVLATATLYIQSAFATLPPEASSHASDPGQGGDHGQAPTQAGGGGTCPPARSFPCR